MDEGTLFFGIPWKEGLCGKPPNQPLSGYEIKVGRKATLICRRQGGRGEKNSSSKYHLNTIEKGMLRPGKKLCKQGVPYKEPQKTAGFALRKRDIPFFCSQQMDVLGYLSQKNICRPDDARLALFICEYLRHHQM